ncbi:Lipocalin-like domain-containing protein [Pelagophyceae sp. CCMP2097]|nr:Lipocalin-like domain-containing protein [Pelagophyceae sp. CCMP2097]
MGQGGSSLPPLVAVAHVDVPKLMGTWYVIGVQPTYFEVGACNCREVYTPAEWADGVQVDFTFNAGFLEGPIKSMPQKGYGWVSDSPASWLVSPFWPLKMPYLVIEQSEVSLDDEEAWFVVGWPNRAYVWIMARKPVMDDSTYENIKTDLVEKHLYPTGLPTLVKVPHKWVEDDVGTLCRA